MPALPRTLLERAREAQARRLAPVLSTGGADLSALTAPRHRGALSRGGCEDISCQARLRAPSAMAAQWNVSHRDAARSATATRGGRRQSCLDRCPCFCRRRRVLPQRRYHPGRDGCPDRASPSAPILRVRSRLGWSCLLPACPPVLVVGWRGGIQSVEIDATMDANVLPARLAPLILDQPSIDLGRIIAAGPSDRTLRGCRHGYPGRFERLGSTP